MSNSDLWKIDKIRPNIDKIRPNINKYRLKSHQIKPKISQILKLKFSNLESKYKSQNSRINSKSAMLCSVAPVSLNKTKINFWGCAISTRCQRDLIHYQNVPIIFMLALPHCLPCLTAFPTQNNCQNVICHQRVHKKFAYGMVKKWVFYQPWKVYLFENQKIHRKRLLSNKFYITIFVIPLCSIQLFLQNWQLLTIALLSLIESGL